MARAERKAIIQQLQTVRNSKLIAYVTGDRQPTPAQIGDDVLRPLYDHVRQIGHVERLDLFIYSRGGAIDVPWRIVNALRRASDQWHVLVPFRANSAATLIALGADEIIMGPQGELGPIDPIMTLPRFFGTPGGSQPSAVQENVSVEDVMAYVRFVHDRVGLSDQRALTHGLKKLTDRLDAVHLGNVYRTHSHIRDVARRILLSQKKPPTDQTLAKIIETLAERVYAHGHAIEVADAIAIGLSAREATGEEDRLMWDLLTAYETDMKLRQPIDPAAKTVTSDFFAESATIAIVESEYAVHEFTGTIEVRVRRQMPQTLTVPVTIPVTLANLDPAQVSAKAQAILQEIITQATQALLPTAQQAVGLALQQQAPALRSESGFRNAVWTRSA